MSIKRFTLKAPQVVLNTASVKPFSMQHTKTVPDKMSAHEITEKLVPHDVRHLVFNCHGWPWRENFPTPHLSIGTVIHPGNVSCFDTLGKIDKLRMIWLCSCGISGSDAGKEFCKEIAKRSGCIVVSQVMLSLDLGSPKGKVPDNVDGMPHYFLKNGEMVSRSHFLTLGTAFGFALD